MISPAARMEEEPVHPGEVEPRGPERAFHDGPQAVLHEIHDVLREDEAHAVRREVPSHDVARAVEELRARRLDARPRSEDAVSSEEDGRGPVPEEGGADDVRGIRGVGQEDLAAELDGHDERALFGPPAQRLGGANEGAGAACAPETEERPAARVRPQPEAGGEQRVDARRREARRRHEEEVVDGVRGHPCLLEARARRPLRERRALLDVVRIALVEGTLREVVLPREREVPGLHTGVEDPQEAQDRGVSREEALVLRARVVLGDDVSRKSGRDGFDERHEPPREPVGGRLFFKQSIGQTSGIIR